MPRTDRELGERVQQLRERDSIQRSQIAAYGIDFAKKRKVDLTFWAPDEPRARQMEAALVRNEMPPYLVLGPGAGEKNQRWLLRASMLASVDFMTEKENLVTFLLFADKYDCEYDGWGTAILEAAGEPLRS